MKTAVSISRNEKGGRVPLYRRISDDIRRDIVTGIYLPGEILPSIREKAAALGVARNTIEQAYLLLTEEGFIRSRRGIGYEILDCKKSFNYEPELDACRKTAAGEQEPDTREDIRGFLIDFRPAIFIGAYLSKSEWKEAVVKIYQEKAVKGASYDRLLRIQVRRYLKKHRGVSCSEKQIFLCRSLEQAMYMVRHVQPHFLYTIPHHEGRLGNHISEEEEEHFLARARNQGFFILEDDIDGELVYGRQPYSTLLSDDNEGRIILTGTLEQVLGGYVQLQYLVFPNTLSTRCRRLDREIRRENRHSFLEIKIAETLMSSDRWENYLRKVNYLLARKRDLMVEKVKQYFGRETVLHRTESGTEMIAELPYSGKEQAFLDSAEQAGVGILARAGVGRKPLNLYLSLCYAAVTKEQIDEGLKELARIYRSRI